jgi:hypothetical protein
VRKPHKKLTVEMNRGFGIILTGILAVLLANLYARPRAAPAG